MTTLNKTFAAVTATLIAASGSAFADAHAAFDANSARLDVSLDTNGDGEVSDDEIINGNMALFDTDGNGAVDADERGVAEQMLMGNRTIELMDTETTVGAPSIDFDVSSARLDVLLDTNGDGEVSDDEIIDGNMALFDTNSNGAIDANERGVAEQSLMSGSVISVDTTSTAGNTTDPLAGLNVNAARMSSVLDRNGDGDVSDDEIIDGNEEFFDLDGNGSLDANERGQAEAALKNE